jgi:hypothetical protein
MLIQKYQIFIFREILNLFEFENVFYLNLNHVFKFQSAEKEIVKPFNFSPPPNSLFGPAQPAQSFLFPFSFSPESSSPQQPLGPSFLAQTNPAQGVFVLPSLCCHVVRCLLFAFRTPSFAIASSAPLPITSAPLIVSSPSETGAIKVHRPPPSLLPDWLSPRCSGTIKSVASTASTPSFLSPLKFCRSSLQHATHCVPLSKILLHRRRPHLVIASSVDTLGEDLVDLLSVFLYPRRGLGHHSTTRQALQRSRGHLVPPVHRPPHHR